MNISVALATHNGLEHLEKQLQSLLQQTLAPKEIIISDDGSSDGTRELLDHYAAIHNNIRVVHTTDQGINQNFQNAASACHGQYIAFCDQDDIWAVDKLAHLFAAFSGTTLLAYGKSLLIDSRGRPHSESAEEYLGFQSNRTGRLPFFFYFSNCISGHTMMVRRDLLHLALPFPEGCLYDQWLAMLASVKSEIVHVPEAITYHRIHDSNAVNNQQTNREKKLRRDKPTKYEKFQKQHSKELLMLTKGLAEGEILSQSEKKYLSQLTSQLKKGDKKIFNIWLFVMLMQKRHQLFHGKWLRECRNRSLGSRYYRLLDFFRSKK